MSRVGADVGHEIGIVKDMRRISQEVEASLKLLRREQGATLAELVEVTGWKPPSVRAFISKRIRKSMGIDVITRKGKELRYIIIDREDNDIINIPLASIPVKRELEWRRRLTRLEGAYAPSTITGYCSDFILFEEWCERHSRTALPASPETVAEFISVMEKERKPASIERYLCGIAKIHLVCELPSPIADHAVKLAMRKMKRSKVVRQKQALGFSGTLKDDLYAVCGDDLYGKRAAALVAVGYDTLCRRSEIVKLLVEDISYLPDGDASILVRRSKTDQLAHGRHAYLSPSAVQRVSIWLDASGIESGYLFRPIHPSFSVKNRIIDKCLHHDVVHRILRKLAKHAGIDPEVACRLSGHSLRVGAALDMAENGIDLVPIMHAGGWKSASMVLRYTQQISLKKTGMALLHAGRSGKNG